MPYIDFWHYNAAHFRIPLYLDTNTIKSAAHVQHIVLDKHHKAVIETLQSSVLEPEQSSAAQELSTAAEL